MNGAKTFLRSIFFAGLGLALGGLIAAAVGEDPAHLYKVMFTGVFGTSYDTGVALYYTTILVFTGLAVAWPLRAGLFNIGGEGQMLVGALCAAWAGISLQEFIPASISPVVGVVAAFAGGALWGSIAGWIRAYRGGHEVISSIMLNFMAAGLTGWMTMSHLKANDSQNPETSLIGEAWRFEKWTWFEGASVTGLTLLAALSAVFLAVVFAKSKRGYEIKAVQIAPKAAHIAGIDVKRVRLGAMTYGGGLAGLAGGVMVLAGTGRFTLDMSSGFGFMGLPVALLAKGSPLGILASAALFGVLQHGASNLDLEAVYVNRDLSQVIQALVVMVVVSEGLFQKAFWRGVFS